MRHANYSVEATTREQVILRDVGPWSEHPTITNDAEWVVGQVAPILGARQLLYWDSLGELSELRVYAGRFVGFAPYHV